MGSLQQVVKHAGTNDMRPSDRRIPNRIRVAMQTDSVSLPQVTAAFLLAAHLYYQSYQAILKGLSASICRHKCAKPDCAQARKGVLVGP